MEANNNVILVPFNSSSNMEFIDTIKDYDADVIYDQTGNPFNLDIYKRQDKPNIVTWLINAGFWARNASTNLNYIVTAGHCRIHEDKLHSFYHYPWHAYKRPEDLRASFIGTLVYFSKEPHDFGLIKATGKNIKISPLIINIDYKEYPLLFIYDHRRINSHGTHICKSGFATHLSCGHTKGFNGILIDSNGITTNLITASLDTRRSDSGGPVFSFKDLRNVHLCVPSLTLKIGKIP
ncbi:streptogrisin A [Gigaspora margarita]|uniref:Streptogrisin A n=1 Tax=Gigaspora margarita TaxID=4874 RepID=A0A8H4AJ75_GIGMA|nr:streptogrisin A [Gigaspora margarita]